MDRRVIVAAANAVLLASGVCCATAAATPRLAAPLDVVALLQAPMPTELAVADQLGGRINALAAEGPHIVAGVGPRVVVFTADADGAPVPVSASEPLPRDVTTIAMRGDLVFAGYGGRFVDDANGLVVIDGSRSGRAERLGTLALEGVPVGIWQHGRQLIVALRLEIASTLPGPTATPFPRPDRRAAFANAAEPRGAIVTIDVSDPWAPRIVDRMPLDVAPIDLAGDGDLIVILAEAQIPGAGRDGVLLALDAAGRGEPRVAGRMALDSGPSPSPGLALESGMAYVAADSALPGLLIVDVRQPDHMHVVATVAMWASDVAVVGSRAYVVGPMRGIIVDVSSPESPREVGILPGRLNGVVADGANVIAFEDAQADDVRLPGNDAAIARFDIALSPDAPVLLGRWSGLVDVTSIAVAQDQVFATLRTDLVATIDAPDGRDPTVEDVRRWREGGWSLVTTQTAVGEGRLAMTSPASSTASVCITSSDGPADAPEGVAACIGLEADAVAIAMRGTLVAAVVKPPIGVPWGPAVPPRSDRSRALRLFDAADPRALRELAYLPLEVVPTGVALGDTAAYVATRDGLIVFDVRDPMAPRAVRSVADVPSKGGHDVRAMDLAGDRLAVIERDGVQLFDVASPLDPRPAGRVAIADAIDVAVAGDALVVATRDVIDRSAVVLYTLEAGEPQRVGRFVPPSAALDIAFQGDRIVVATRESGIYWLAASGANAAASRVRTLWLPLVIR